MNVLYAGMNEINSELRRTQNELTLLEDFELFVSLAGYNIFHCKERKGRKDSLIEPYAIDHRGHREKWQSSAIPVTTYEKPAASRFRTRMTWIFTNPRVSASSAQSAILRRLSTFIRVHLQLISVSLSDRVQKIKGEI